MDLINFLSHGESRMLADEFRVSKMAVSRALRSHRTNELAQRIRSKASFMIDKKMEEWKKNRELFINEGRLPAEEGR